MNEIFERLEGQPRAKTILQAAAGTPGGSYLFVGPPGAGKTEASRVFAAALLCLDKCGTCNICTRVLREIHPDVSTYGPEGLTFPVEVIREMVASSSLTPLEAKYRVMIVEDAGRIVERSQNALLKALEEPNASVTWILISDAVDPFLPTILSRCQIVEFTPVAEELAVPVVRSRLSVGDEEAFLAVRASRGDLDRALALAGDDSVREVRRLAIDSAVAVGAGHVSFLEMADRVKRAAASVRSELERAQSEELERMSEVLSGSGRRRLTEKHRRALRKVETEVFIDFLVWLGIVFRDLAALSSGRPAEEVTNSDRAADMVEAAPSRPTGQWLDLAEATLEGELAISENANAGLVVESLLLRLA